jgi:sulfite reductase (ferredoxin)
MSEHLVLSFPCERLPDEPAVARLLGIYPQRQEGLYMQRVKIHAGRLSIAQWRAVAELARRFTPGAGLFLTTRQDIELHNVGADDLPAIQQGLDEVGLSGVGACGDTVRNVTGCPGCDLEPGAVDVTALAGAIKAAVETLPWMRSLPRKFKIGLSGCSKACARPWINDVGLIASEDGTFQVIVAGSLGARPGTGIPYPRPLKVDEVIPLVVAAMRLFEAEGDRANRSKARLRHVRERMGNEAFLERLTAAFEQEKKEGTWPVPVARRVPDEGARLVGRLFPPLGDVGCDEAVELANVLEASGAQVRIGFEHDLLIFGRRPPAWTPTLERWAKGPRVVACPGTTWCSRGIADTRIAASKVYKALPPRCDLTVCISGCPNGCAQSAVADIGLVGLIRTIDGTRTECFRVLVGGDGGRGPALARETQPIVTLDDVGDVVAKLAEDGPARKNGNGASRA